MRKIFRAAVVALTLVPTAAFTQDYAAGLRAYWAGNYEAALNEWLPLAEQGDAVAQKFLGSMYQEGKGVPQDFAEAAKWYRLLAEQGDALAQTNLGSIYANGEGVPQDFVSAYMWWNVASANGNERAREQRDSISLKMTPANVSEAQRRSRICMESGYWDCD